jgi:hypothetical protein
MQCEFKNFFNVISDQNIVQIKEQRFPIEKTRDYFDSVFKVGSPGIREKDDLKASFFLMGDALFEVIVPKISEVINHKSFLIISILKILAEFFE